jgi:hypothetical protein
MSGDLQFLKPVSKSLVESMSLRLTGRREQKDADTLRRTLFAAAAPVVSHEPSEVEQASWSKLQTRDCECEPLRESKLGDLRGRELSAALSSGRRGRQEVISMLSSAKLS